MIICDKMILLLKLRTIQASVKHVAALVCSFCVNGDCLLDIWTNKTLKTCKQWCVYSGGVRSNQSKLEEKMMRMLDNSCIQTDL